jgi:RNA polymerase sigma-70 factor (sigma-E family)
VPVQSFEQFASERAATLLRYATALTCDPDLAQDVVQDTLVRVQPRWSRIGAMDAPLAYVKRMVTTEYLSWRRRKAVREVATGHGGVEVALADPATDYDERDAMLGRIAALPPKQRAAVVLRYYDNRTDAEIGEILGCRPGTVRSHLSHAMTALRADAELMIVKEGR